MTEMQSVQSMPIPIGGVIVDDNDHVAENVELIFDAAERWQRGELHWTEAAKVGAITWREKPSPWFTRFVARWLYKDDPRCATLDALCDHLIAQSGIKRTKQGHYQPHELRASDDVIRHLQSTGALPQFIDPKGRRS